MHRQTSADHLFSWFEGLILRFKLTRYAVEDSLGAMAVACTLPAYISADSSCRMNRFGVSVVTPPNPYPPAVYARKAYGIPQD